jgi:CheY-like chemotaxis protein
MKSCRNIWDESMKTRAKILIVDDEPFNLDYLEQELEGSDCEIFTAANGREALEKVRTTLQIWSCWTL